MAERPGCPSCRQPVFRLQRWAPAHAPAGPAIAYPCQCWVPPHKAAELVDAYRTYATSPIEEAA